MNDLLKERDERTKRRKKFKKRIDSEYNLAYKDDETIMLSTNGTMSLATKKIRLLDEGAVVGDEYVDFIIRKGTLEKFLNGENKHLPNLTDDFVGTVNLGHMDFATFPFIIGEWTKKDLTLVDIGDDRFGIDVKVKLDKNSVFVQELKKQSYDIGISSEFFYNVDWEATEDIGTLVIDEVYIFAYALVGECGNVNSSGLELKGDFEMNKEQVKIDLEVEGVDEVTENLAELSEEVETEEIETVDETETEDVIEDSVDEIDETETDEETEDEEVDDDEEVDGEDVELTAVESMITDLQNEVEELKAQNAALKKTNNRLKRKLEDEKSKKEAFINKFSEMASKVGVDDAPKEKTDKVTDYVYGDGIGE